MIENEEVLEPEEELDDSYYDSYYDYDYEEEDLSPYYMLFDKGLLTDEVVARVRLWLVELRSNKYEQGAGKLCRDGKYCCLGVANLVCNLGETHEELLDGTYEMLGLQTHDGAYYQGDDCLTEDNDRGKSFAEIADFIEEQLNKALEEIKNDQN